MNIKLEITNEKGNLVIVTGDHQMDLDTLKFWIIEKIKKGKIIIKPTSLLSLKESE